MRTFVAIEIPKDIQKAVADYTYSIKGLFKNIKWVAPDNLHLTLKFLGNINEAYWMGADPHQWMCTRADWKFYDISVEGDTRYSMIFEFQKHPVSWNPTVTFRDERTGRPPPDLGAGEGWKYVTWQLEVDFDSLLGFLIEGY